MSDDALRAERVTRRFGEAGVDAVDLTVAHGEIVALVGLNGAGKTTLLRLLLGMLHPASGRVLLNGRPLPQTTPHDWAVVGHVVDHGLVYPELTTRQNLVMAARLRGAASPDRIAAASLRTYALEPYASRRARALSLGNRQRVALAAAMQHDPSVVVLDEPGNALDPRGVIILRDALTRLAAQGAGVLVSSHHLDEVARIADRIVVMNAGRVIGELPPAASGLERALFEAVRIDDEALAGAAS